MNAHPANNVSSLHDALGECGVGVNRLGQLVHAELPGYRHGGLKEFVAGKGRPGCLGWIVPGQGASSITHQHRFLLPFR